MITETLDPIEVAAMQAQRIQTLERQRDEAVDRALAAEMALAHLQLHFLPVKRGSIGPKGWCKPEDANKEALALRIDERQVLIFPDIDLTAAREMREKAEKVDKIIADEQQIAVKAQQDADALRADAICFWDTMRAIAVDGLGLTDPFECDSNELPKDWKRFEKLSQAVADQRRQLQEAEALVGRYKEALDSGYAYVLRELADLQEDSSPEADAEYAETLRDEKELRDLLALTAAAALSDYRGGVLEEVAKLAIDKAKYHDIEAEDPESNLAVERARAIAFHVFAAEIRAMKAKS